MISFHDIVNGLHQLNLDHSRPIIAHVSLSSIGDVRGDAETVLGALLTCTEALMMPVFTFKTMVIPETGPENNALAYGSGKINNSMAEIFKPDTPADPLMGVVAEKLRLHPKSARSNHPLLSFAGINVKVALQSQTIEEPYAPIRVLLEQNGWILLLGVDHSVNISLHYAEKLAGCKQFTRWALTPAGARECPYFPGCSNGFYQTKFALKSITQKVKIGMASAQALPLKPMVEIIANLLTEDPMALLCKKPNCERCNNIRNQIFHPF